jgi:hypothetical protein
MNKKKGKKFTGQWLDYFQIFKFRSKNVFILMIII